MLHIFLLLLGGTLFYYKDPIITFVKEKRDKCRSLNTLVESQYNNPWMVIWVSASLLTKMTWLSFLQRINGSVQRLDKHRYELTYVINGRIHKMIVKPKNGPPSILAALDENKTDVTHKILPYLGPGENFHGYRFCPADFGLKKVTFDLSSGQSIFFDTNDTIILEEN